MVPLYALFCSQFAATNREVELPKTSEDGESLRLYQARYNYLKNTIGNKLLRIKTSVFQEYTLNGERIEANRYIRTTQRRGEYGFIFTG